MNLEELKIKKDELNKRIDNTNKKIMEKELKKENCIERLNKFGIKEENLDKEIDNMQEKYNILCKKIEAGMLKVEKSLTEIEEILND